MVLSKIIMLLIIIIDFLYNICNILYGGNIFNSNSKIPV